jgi:nucleoside-diphosphate-sugar epimerase
VRILVTGGLGYLGCSLIQLLGATGSRVLVLDRGTFGVRHAFQTMSPRVELIIGDIRDDYLVRDLVERTDVVVHLAALVGGPVCARHPWESESINVGGTKILARYVREFKRKFIFASTGTTYGEMDSECDERKPISPKTGYGRQKAEAEGYVFDADGIALRFSTVFGLSGRTRDDLFIHSVIQKAIRDQSMVLYEGDALRSFISIKDAARAVRHFIDSQTYAGPFNIGDPRLAMTKREVCESVRTILPEFTVVENSFSFDKDRRNYKVSFKKLAETGFNCVSDFEAELNSLVKYYGAIHISSLDNG